MHYDDLIVDIEKIPIERGEIEKNLRFLLEYAIYIEELDDVEDPLAKGLLDAVPLFIRKQTERLLIHIDDEADIIAWLSRGLMELFFTLRYMYSSRDRYDEVIKEQLKDLKEIEDVIYPNGSPSPNDPDKIIDFHSEMKRLWEAMEHYGVDRDNLRRPNAVRQYAEGANLLHEYSRSWRIHSKYVHPTSYLLFGKRSFVFGDDAKLFFWIMAQYYLAWNLRDLHRMVEEAKALKRKIE